MLAGKIRLFGNAPTTHLLLAIFVLITNELAPKITLLPILQSPIMLERENNVTPYPNFGYTFVVAPMVTFW